MPTSTVPLQAPLFRACWLALALPFRTARISCRPSRNRRSKRSNRMGEAPAMIEKHRGVEAPIARQWSIAEHAPPEWENGLLFHNKADRVVVDGAEQHDCGANREAGRNESPGYALRCFQRLGCREVSRGSSFRRPDRPGAFCAALGQTGGRHLYNGTTLNCAEAEFIRSNR
jgi:hypothetical protein